MNQHIRDHLRYLGRNEEGTQSPAETLKAGSGSCRDFALLMMEAARRLGFATRFVSGYLYDPALDGEEDSNVVGAGYTHAWLQAYLPGAGWVPFDPTNNLLGGTHLIRVGIARDPSQAAPISGSWFGETDDYIGMTVSVTVKRRADAMGARRPVVSVEAARGRCGLPRPLKAAGRAARRRRTIVANRQARRTDWRGRPRAKSRDARARRKAAAPAIAARRIDRPARGRTPSATPSSAPGHRSSRGGSAGS
jgi:hypothetical protein